MPKLNCFQKIGNAITSSLEQFFYFWGYSIGRHPFHFICTCLIFTVICCLGLFNFHRETRPERLFIPHGSTYYNTTVWFRTNFPAPFRQEFAIVTDIDVLQPKVMQKMLEVHEKVARFNISSGKTWNDVCFKLPVITSMGDDMELIKGFRNRIIMKREIGKAATLSPFDDYDFSDFDKDVFSIIDKGKETDTGSSSNKKHKSSSQSTNTSVISLMSGSDFDLDFNSEFYSDTFRNVQTNSTDLSVIMPSELYCAFVESVPRACWEFSLLELWNYDEEIIINLTKEDIVNALNKAKESPVFGSPADYTPLLGGKVYDSAGRIISATALMTMWHVEVNQSSIRVNTDLLDSGLADPADPDSLEWEARFLDILLDDNADSKVLVRAWRSIADLGVETMKRGLWPILYGYLCMFVYISFMLSEFGIVDSKIMSTVMGLVAVGMAFFCTLGICSALNVMFGPIHINIGILLLGLGVDDMFVISQCWNTLPDADKVRPIEEKIGLTMKHAGVSITITSLTNFVAFMIGSTSLFPYISSYCTYLAVGIAVVYIFQATYYVAWFTLEQKRIMAKRNPLLCCIVHNNSTKSNFLSPKQILQVAFNHFAPLIKKIYFKVVIFIISIFFICFSIWGIGQLEIKYQVEWIIQKDSYLLKFSNTLLSQYKTHGEEGVFILYGVNYTSDLPTIEHFVNKVRSNTDIVAFIDDWYTDFKHYVNTNYKEDIPKHPIQSEQKFLSYLGQFLFSPSGAQHQKSFRFDEPLECGKPAPSFQICLIPFQMRRFSGVQEHVPALYRIKSMVENVTLNENHAWISIWSHVFVIWETDSSVFMETVRSLLLASLCVFVCTLIALTSIPTSMLVMSCVFLTLLEVLGFMHLWDLQINILTALALVMSIGMSVDFAAHIGHSFLTIQGNRNDRASQAFRNIGPAVFNGGVSTLLAYSFLMQAQVIALAIFLKMFVLVVMFGLFNGLLFLPVLLSLIGPAPYLHNTVARHKANNAQTQDNENAESHQFIVINSKQPQNGHRHNSVNEIQEETGLNCNSNHCPDEK